MNVRPALVALFASLSACTSANFDVAASDGGGGEDSGSLDDTAIADTALADSGSEDSAVADSGTTDSVSPCTPLDSAATTIYVDQRTTRTAVGTADCPTKTIREAIAIVGALPSGKHTIKVAGGAVGSPLTYSETAEVVLKSGTTLAGDGPARVIITGGGMCSGSPCVVVMEGGSSLDGVKIDANGAKFPLIVGPAAFTGCTVSHTQVTGVKGSATIPAIYINGKGAVELGPEIVVSKNSAFGVYAEDIFSIHVSASGNRFNENLAGFVMKTGGLNFDGGEVASNTTVGMALGASSGTTLNIDTLDAHDNGQQGLVVANGASLKLRRSSLLKNGRYGLVFTFVDGIISNDLDLGKPLDQGKNIFGGASANNNWGGVCLPVARSSKSDAIGNRWKNCDPMQIARSTMGEPSAPCDDKPEALSDVSYVNSASGGVPLDTKGCTLGP